MPELIETPSRVEAAGTKPKLIDEFVGRVNTREERLSVARMQSPEGWQEPGQRPDFDEYTVVLDGALRVEHEHGELDVRPGQAVLARAGEWVRYSTPEVGGAHYVAICLPAFSPETVQWVLDFSREVAQGVARPGAPVGAFLAGVAVGRRISDGPQALEDVKRTLEPTFNTDPA